MNRKKNPHAVALGRLGGLAGGWLKWWRSLTPEQQREHQRKASAKRWSKRPTPAPPAGEAQAMGPGAGAPDQGACFPPR